MKTLPLRHGLILILTIGFTVITVIAISKVTGKKENYRDFDRSLYQNKDKLIIKDGSNKKHKNIYFFTK